MVLLQLRFQNGFEEVRQSIIQLKKRKLTCGHGRLSMPHSDCGYFNPPGFRRSPNVIVLRWIPLGLQSAKGLHDQ